MDILEIHCIKFMHTVFWFNVGSAVEALFLNSQNAWHFETNAYAMMSPFFVRSSPTAGHGCPPKQYPLTEHPHTHNHCLSFSVNQSRSLMP